MSKIRINDLARELEVKSKVIVDLLPELGVQEKKSHSSAIDDEIGDRVRVHFRALSQEAPAEESKEISPAAPVAAGPVPAPVPVETKKPSEVRLESQPLTRSIAEIKAAARKTVGPQPVPAAPPRPVVGLVPPQRPAARPTMPWPSAGPVTVLPAVPLPSAAAPKGEMPAARASAASADVIQPGRLGEAPLPPPLPARPSRATKAQKSAASSQPIYPPVTVRKGIPVRPLVPRRPGEPRPMHPTAARPTPAASGGVPSVRPPVVPPVMLPPRVGPPVPRMAPPKPVVPEEVPITRKITISEGVSVKELSEKLEVRAKEVIKKLLEKGIFATINQTLDSQTGTEVARLFGADTAVISFEEEVMQEVEEADRPEDLQPRAPVVTVMGHVDHGKTSLLDAIRETNVAGKEAGGITQRIGAYQVEAQGRKITFIDTPGHEAFTLMRARGAKVTDIVVLVVAADDGVMPQTVEAINHARAAKVPILVAVNKIDKPEADPERVKRQLADHGLMPEAWGGDTVTVEVSAKRRINLDLSLEMILLVADLQGMKANPKRLPSGTVLEGKLDRGRGPVATVLIQNGTLRVGDPLIVGAIFGKVRAMFDDRGRPVIEGGPSTAVEVLGLEDVPRAGDRMQGIENTLKARQIAVHRQAKLREAALAKSARLTLQQLHEQLAAGDVKELPLVVKADVQGTTEALTEMLNKLSTDKVKIKVIHAGVGAITETDVLLASASNAVVIGFNVRPERKASELAQLENVDIRLHTVIYEVTEEIKKAMGGLLPVTIKETALGRAEVVDTFRISRVGTVAGCQVQDGKITREAHVRLLRDHVVVYEGHVRSLRRFKEDVSEVRSGMECGVALENFNDVKVGDVIEAFVTEKVVEPALV